jgi:hypothetical protein
MSNLNQISTEICGEELSALLDVDIARCPVCNGVFTFNAAHWLHGETTLENGDWSETIAFGCPCCESTGPMSSNRLEAIWGWNVLVGADERMRLLHKTL